MAVGLALMMGFVLIQNFDSPYKSRSITEFWRRWHISLSTWLREYLYIPLGGNRKGPVRTYFNLMLVMLLGGLWHGAAWSYAVWGLFHGLGLAVERFWQKAKPVPATGWRAGLGMLGVFTFVTFAWLLFKLPDFKDVVAFVKACFENLALSNSPRLIAFILLYSFPVVAYHGFYLWRQKTGLQLSPQWRPVPYGACLFALLVNSGSPGAFIYFQF